MSHQTAKGFELDEIVNYHLPELSFRIRPASTARHNLDEDRTRLQVSFELLGANYQPKYS
jgi:hypothetical protein